jgi:hypothetical protein
VPFRFTGKINKVGLLAIGAAMRARSFLPLALAGLAVAGCQSAAQMLAAEQPAALQAATRRGQFEMSCPQATGTVLSSNLLQPAMWGGLERAEYTIGVEGCGQRRTYIAVCQVGGPACFAVSGR